MGIWKSVASSLSGLGSHVAGKVVHEPVEVLRDMVGEKIEQAQAGQQASSDPFNAVDPVADLAKAGFKTKEDFDKYTGLAEQRDELALKNIRGKLVREWGLDTTIEGGMQKARIEWEQKEEQRKKVEEKQEEEKKEFEFLKKQQEDIGLKAAKGEASPENKAWGAG